MFSAATLPPMRRAATLAYVIFALAASLPAEIRECLPMAKACARLAPPAKSCSLASSGRSACPLAAARSKCGASPVRRAPLPADCRLHPTPDGTTPREPAPLPAPLLAWTADLRVPALEIPPPDPTREGWIEPPAVRPRAAPRAAPFSPRPPPIAA